MYGLFRATEVAYYSYIYAKVDKEHYQKVTSHTRGAILAGRSISGVASQVLVSTKVLDYEQLNYISLAGKYTLEGCIISHSTPQSALTSVI